VWLGLAPAVYAQAEPLEPGREVRLFVRGVAGPFEGLLTSATREALGITLRDGRDFTFTPSQLERTEVLSSRRNTLRGAILGGAVGLGVGVFLVVTDEGSPDPTAPGGGFRTEFDGWKLVVPPIAGTALGAFFGSSVRTPRWVPGLLPAAGAASGDVAFGWSIRLPG
jgi:hypothetical protein